MGRKILITKLSKYSCAEDGTLTTEPVERIEGLDELREALAKYGYIADQEDSQLSFSEEWYPVDEFKMRSIVKAARAYLKLQGGD